jgi:SAM-dependent methyltransferase
MQVHLDHPANEALCDPLCLRVEGWLQFDGSRQPGTIVEIWLDGVKIGETALLSRRADLAAAAGAAGGECNGFLHFAHTPPLARTDPSGLEIRVRVPGATSSGALVRRAIRLLNRDYRKNHYGVLLDQATTAVYRRENIYGSGPSQPGGSQEALELLKRYLGQPPLRVLDIGCGLGWYGKELRKDGYDWCGAEVKTSDCAELERERLPHVHVNGSSLPFTDGAFDAAMCIEVLEHTENPRAFLAEARRVAPRRLIISVPNIEMIPYLQDYQAVPWHLLEGDHKNFFTRWNLGSLLREYYAHVEVMCYHRHPLPTPEGIPLFYHLFAVAWTP